MWISNSYFQPFWWFVGSYWELKRNLGPRLSMLVRIGDRKLVVENIISPICAFTFCIHIHTHTHIHIYCIYVHVYDCFYIHKVIVFLSFLFYTLFSLSFFLHFGIYRMLNIIFATCLSIGQKKITWLNMTWKLSNYPNVQKPFYYCFFSKLPLQQLSKHNIVPAPYNKLKLVHHLFGTV
jgi:hypothetical protein